MEILKVEVKKTGSYGKAEYVYEGTEVKNALKSDILSSQIKSKDYIVRFFVEVLDDVYVASAKESYSSIEEALDSMETVCVDEKLEKAIIEFIKRMLNV